MRVFLTVNPLLVRGARFQTVRSMVTALATQCELIVVPLDRIDFRRARVTGYRREHGGRFASIGSFAPHGTLWINYSDGFYLDHAALGFASPGLFLQAQHDFYESLRARGHVARVINTVAAERATLKLWLERFTRADLRVIPTHRLARRAKTTMQRRLADLQSRYGALVVKPNWGGAGQQVVRLDSLASTRTFIEAIDTRLTHPLDALCVQPLVEGPEKRLWFVGDTCVDGRIIEHRPRPWDGVGTRSTRIARYFYDKPIQSNAARPQRVAARQFARDLAAAQAVWRLSGLEIGSVDFIGEQINELNGCGTTFTQYDRWHCVADARPQLVRWLRDQVRSAS